jgi:iron(III) transport system ATP-binding protein
VLRPESAVLADQGQLPCKVILSCFMGSYQNYHVTVGDTLVKITDFNPKSKKIYQVGDNAWVNFSRDDVHVL